MHRRKHLSGFGGRKFIATMAACAAAAGCGYCTELGCSLIPADIVFTGLSLESDDVVTALVSEKEGVEGFECCYTPSMDPSRCGGLKAACSHVRYGFDLVGDELHLFVPNEVDAVRVRLVRNGNIELDRSIALVWTRYYPNGESCDADWGGCAVGPRVVVPIDGG